MGLNDPHELCWRFDSLVLELVSGGDIWKDRERLELSRWED